MSDLATELFRFDRHERVLGSAATLEKRRFDVFHFATAIVFGLEFVSQDLGMSKLTALHERLVAARKDEGGVT